jgi:hypothetical protein
MEHKITIFVDEGPPIAHKVKKKTGCDLLALQFFLSNLK